MLRGYMRKAALQPATEGNGSGPQRGIDRNGRGFDPAPPSPASTL